MLFSHIGRFFSVNTKLDPITDRVNKTCSTLTPMYESLENTRRGPIAHLFILLPEHATPRRSNLTSPIDLALSRFANSKKRRHKQLLECFCFFLDILQHVYGKNIMYSLHWSSYRQLKTMRKIVLSIFFGFLEEF